MALSADGRLTVSSGPDGLVRVWEAATGRCLTVLTGHTAGVRDVALSADGRLMVGAGADGALRLWDVRGHALLRTMRPDRHFERMDITGLTGVTDAQRAALLTLGAVDRSGHTTPAS